MKLKSIPRKLGFILGAQWTRDLSWTIFTILLARHSPDILGQIVLALTYGYLVKTAADVGLNDFLLSTFARNSVRPRTLLAEVTWLKLAALVIAISVTWIITIWQGYGRGLQIIILCIAGGLGLDAISDSFFALCQARGRQDVEMRIRIPASLLGLGYGIIAVILGFPAVAIALFKPVEAVVCIIFAAISLGKNPVKMRENSVWTHLWKQMKPGFVFTGMAACAMFYNKINVIFLKKYGGNADVASYGVAWETIEGLSVLVSSALLGKVIFPILARLWEQNRTEFRILAGQTARSLWAAALPLIYLIYVESDRFVPLIYGEQYKTAVIAQQLLTPCLATAFLHNLAAYAMIGMRRQKLLFAFYISGVVVNIFCCFLLIPINALAGAAATLTITKVWVALLTVSFFQYHSKPMTAFQWCVMLGACVLSLLLWKSTIGLMPRELSELCGVTPLFILFWMWRPPRMFEKSKI